MELLVVLVLGGVVGWVASMLMGNSSLSVVGNVIVGILGSLLANFLLAPLFGQHASLSSLSFTGLLMALLGACVLLFVVNLFTRREVV